MDKQAKRPRRIWIWALAALMALLPVAAITAHFAWVYGGTSEWQLAIYRDGVQVHTRKVPGIAVLQVKATTTVAVPIGKALAAMKDTDVRTCAEWISGCARGQAIQPWDPNSRSLVHLYDVEFPAPFAVREFLLKTTFKREPATSTVRVDFIATPNAVPRNACCYRIARMHNVWRFTPRDAATTDVEFTQDMDFGVPYPLMNMMAAESLFDLFAQLPALMGKAQYAAVDMPLD
jgi:hypothetical protein